MSASTGRSLHDRSHKGLYIAHSKTHSNAMSSLVFRQHGGAVQRHIITCLLQAVWRHCLMPNHASHAGCVEALSKDRALLLAFWTVHRPPSATALALALRLQHALAATPPAAWCAAAQGGAVYLMTSLLPVTPAPAHEAVSVCSRSLHSASTAPIHEAAPPVYLHPSQLSAIGRASACCWSIFLAGPDHH